MDMVIREAALEDAAEIHNKIPEFDKQELAYFYERIADKERLVIIAHADDEPVGYLIAYELGDSFYCWLTGVLPEFRSKGTMKRMMDYLYDWAKLRGYKKITIKTRNKRREMLDYLVKNGFNFVKVLRKDDPLENRILMEKILN